MPVNSTLNPQPHTSRRTDFYACAVIDEQGREVPITEAMIQQACRELDPHQDEEQPSSD